MMQHKFTFSFNIEASMEFKTAKMTKLHAIFSLIKFKDIYKRVSDYIFTCLYQKKSEIIKRWTKRHDYINEPNVKRLFSGKKFAGIQNGILILYTIYNYNFILVTLTNLGAGSQFEALRAPCTL